MSKKFKHVAVSFVIIEKLGLGESAVYGIIWSREQLEKGYCFESYETMGKLLGYSKRQIGRFISNLIEAGLVKDITGFHSLETKKLGLAKRLVTVPEVLEEMEKSTSAKMSMVTKDNLSTTKDILSTTSAKMSMEQRQNVLVDNSSNNKKIINNKEDFSNSFLKSKHDPLVVNKLRVYLTEHLKINPIGKKWDELIEFMLDRQVKHGERIDTFIRWFCKGKTVDMIYWSPERIMTVYPQAYGVNNDSDEWHDPEPLPKES